MKNSKSGQAGVVVLVYLVCVILLIGCWIGNFVKFIKSDFEAPYKREIIHGVGIIPAISLITVWFDIDEATGEVTGGIAD